MSLRLPAVFQCRLFHLLTLSMFAATITACSGPSPVNTSASGERYREIVNDAVRTDADRQADARRSPVPLLQFVDVRPGMRVLDIAAGGGYTTQLLALAAGSGGKVWAQVDKPRPALEQRLTAHPQSNIVVAVRPYDDPVPPDAAPLDRVTLILNYHDIAYMPVDRPKMVKRIFDALAPGGTFVIVDHAARQGAGLTETKTLHRIDEESVIAELTQAGFRLDGSGDFLRNPADTRNKPSQDKAVSSDKFVLRFVKP